MKLKILHTGNKIGLTGKLKGIEVKYKWVHPIEEKPVLNKPNFYLGLFFAVLILSALIYTKKADLMFMIFLFAAILNSVFAYVSWRKKLKISKQPSVFRDIT